MGDCGLHVGQDHDILEGDGDSVICEECLATVGTKLGDGHEGVGSDVWKDMC
jgi:hypothetical protein